MVWAIALTILAITVALRSGAGSCARSAKLLCDFGVRAAFPKSGRPDLATSYDQALEVHPHFAVALELKDALAAYVQDKNI